MGVLQGMPLNAHDKYSFDLPPIASQDDWENLVNKTLNDAETVSALIEKLPEENFGKILPIPNMELITGTFTVLLSMFIITWDKWFL